MCTRWVVRVVSVVCIAMLCAVLTPAVAENESTVRETGRLLAVLLDVGRVVIGHNQLLLNDPTKGNKGFTPEVFAQQTIQAFKERTGHDLANLSTIAVPEMAKPLLERLLDESKKTVASYQMVINMPGINPVVLAQVTMVDAFVVAPLVKTMGTVRLPVAPRCLTSAAARTAVAVQVFIAPASPLAVEPFEKISRKAGAVVCAPAL